MDIRCFHIGLAGWIIALVSTGFSESYPNRPTVLEMGNLVISGTQCARGVRERCLATQYSTNPVSYYVSAPEFAGTNGGWYFDADLLMILDTKAKALVPYFANPDTIYAGTTNITMLSVPGVWAELEIGDRTNKFTGTPAMGTNPPTYGDYPWRIYPETLDERRDVLNICQKRLLGSYAGTSFPSVVRTATVWGQGTMAAGGNCRVWYSLYGDDLGPADGTVYHIEIDARCFNGQGNVDDISLSWGGTPWGFKSEIFQISLDTAQGTDETTFSAGLTLDAAPSVIKIWNCMLGYASDPEDTTIDYNDSSVEISAVLDRRNMAEECASFGFYATINFPFLYCK